MLQEFKDFLMRGNIVELAVAFVIGVAFAAVVNSLVNDLIMPIIAMIIGKPDFSDLTFTINDAVFRYGAFITAVITFVAIAAAVFFFVVKPMEAIKARVQKRGGETISDEERRHQELLAALRARQQPKGVARQSLPRLRQTRGGGSRRGRRTARSSNRMRAAPRTAPTATGAASAAG